MPYKLAMVTKKHLVGYAPRVNYDQRSRSMVHILGITVAVVIVGQCCLLLNVRVIIDNDDALGVFHVFTLQYQYQKFVS
jgi:hypothetical protein